MHATSPPAALPVAAAIIPLVIAALVPLAVPSSALAERWLRPVPGEVARSFDYARADPFAGGAHRGADLAAAPGATVRAACSGVVLHAGAVAGRGVASVRCGARRVSYLPLATIAAREGRAIAAGAPLGTLARGHGGLHVGVRRNGDSFAYEDPLALFATRHPPAVPLALRRRGRPRRIALPRIPPPRAAQRRIASRVETPSRQPPLPVLAADHAARDRFESPQPHAPVAPWPVWLGIALLATGAAGSRTLSMRRRRRRRATVHTTPTTYPSTR